VKISSKLILLILLSVLMIAFQFGIGRVLDRKMDAYIRATHNLNRMSEGLLGAIIEEKNYINTHKEHALDSALRYIQGAEREFATLDPGAVGAEDMESIGGLLRSYQEALTRLAGITRELDAMENDFQSATASFNERAGTVVLKLSEEIGIKLANAQDPPEHLRSLLEITRQANLLINQSYLSMNQDLFVNNDVEAYTASIVRLYAELRKEKKNAEAFSRFVKGTAYFDFIRQVMMQTIDRLPEQTAGVRDLWTKRHMQEIELDALRGRILTLKNQVLSACEDKVDNLSSRLFRINVGAVCLTVLAVFAVGMGILRSISRPITRLIQSAKEIAEGDLRQASIGIAPESLPGAGNGVKPPKDEIRQLSMAFGQMAQSIQSLVGQVRSSGIRVVSSATHISTSARELEATAAQQSASVNEVNATSRQISSSSRELVNTMAEVAQVASHTAALAAEGQGGLLGMESTMHQLMESTASIASKLEIISGKTENIGSIVTAITQVADQTNLLSLNAAIEAEKAGQYGLGFSVVAREIRRLADQSAIATLEIEQMVKEMQSAVSSGVLEVDQFVQEVRRGGETVVRISGQLAAVIAQVQALIPRFDAVNREVEAQSTGADEIHQAMGQLSQGAEQTRQVVSEFNHAVAQLTDSIQGLQREVSKFKIGA
jgi:methyl-accepting chemotaxis protein WspA